MAHVLDVPPRRSRTAVAAMLVLALLLAGLLPALFARSDALEPAPSESATQKLVVKPSQAAAPSKQRPAGLEDRPRRGLIYQGLGLSKKCPGGYLLEGTDDVCTHGPDPAGGEHGPAGASKAEAHDHATHDHEATDQRANADRTDVRDVPTTSELIEAAGELLPSSTSSTAGLIPCYGDGVSGPRVQMVYAVPSDRTNRYQALADTFPIYAARTNAAFSQSAEATGGSRNLRFVHTSDCRLSVLQVVLSPTGDDTFANMVTELRNVGLTRTDRKYMVWMDAAVYCGVASVVQDETSGTTNRSNLGPTFARVDAGCWGSSSSVEAHEIAHTLGAVQLGAPNSNGAWHCTDEYDRMCYNDGSGATMTYVCPSNIEALLDCNGNDYFNVSPAPGSYLAGHWNLADSVFLSSAAPDATGTTPTPSPSPSPSTSTTTPSPSPTATSSPTADPAPTPTASPTSTGSMTTSTFSGSLNKKQTFRDYPVTVGSGPVAGVLTVSKGKTMRLTLVGPDGTTVATASGSGTFRLAGSDVMPGTHVFRVDGATSGSFGLAVTYRAP